MVPAKTAPGASCTPPPARGGARARHGKGLPDGEDHEGVAAARSAALPHLVQHPPRPTQKAGLNCLSRAGEPPLNYPCSDSQGAQTARATSLQALLPPFPSPRAGDMYAAAAQPGAVAAHRHTL